MEVSEIVVSGLGGVSRQDTPEARSRIAEGYENQGKSPFGNWIGGNPPWVVSTVRMPRSQADSTSMR